MTKNEVIWKLIKDNSAYWSELSELRAKVAILHSYVDAADSKYLGKAYGGSVDTDTLRMIFGWPSQPLTDEGREDEREPGGGVAAE